VDFTNFIVADGLLNYSMNWYTTGNDPPRQILMENIFFSISYSIILVTGYYREERFLIAASDVSAM